MIGLVDVNNIKNVSRKNVQHLKTVGITIKVSPAMRDWLKENEISPTGLFNEALKDIGCPLVKGKQK